jgi:LmbE family N-acetylglucosaminyl deacetylase
MNYSHALFVVAHPDDEVIGAGSLLSRFEHCRIVHVTDGAPADMRDARRAGFEARNDYAQARRSEAVTALSLAGIAEDQIIELGLPDQQSSYQLVSLVQRLYELLRQLRPQIVITQPFEGGHPDHDATAFAVHQARRLLLYENETAPEIFEMTSYHRRDDYVVYSEFLPRADSDCTTFVLSEDEKTRKRKMFECFATQREVLRWFPIEVERFRRAPDYDFTRPPHAGKLHYEYFDWGTTRDQWLSLARAALRVLDQGGSNAAHDFERGVSADTGRT